MLRATKPVRGKVALTFNLKTIFDKVEEKVVEIENFDDKPRDQFSEEALMQYWSEFLADLQRQNKIPAFNALQSGEVKLKDDFVIDFEFSSATLANEFRLQRESLMNFLREKLNNYGIDFNVKVISTHNINYIKTNSEIFNALAEKNPLLAKMREELGLDYDSDD